MIIEKIDLKFKSGNSIDVERAIIYKAEWDEVKKESIPREKVEALLDEYKAMESMFGGGDVCVEAVIEKLEKLIEE